MSIYRQYRMIPKEGGKSELEIALAKLAEQVRALPGCKCVEVLSIIGEADGFVFTEQWASIEDHKRGGEILGPGAFAPIGNLLLDKPQGNYLIRTA
jgi:heme-degrading monooxygenase HmoA